VLDDPTVRLSPACLTYVLVRSFVRQLFSFHGDTYTFPWTKLIVSTANTGTGEESESWKDLWPSMQPFTEEICRATWLLLVCQD
jgi:hypothetical protein